MKNEIKCISDIEREFAEVETDEEISGKVFEEIKSFYRQKITNLLEEMKQDKELFYTVPMNKWEEGNNASSKEFNDKLEQAKK